MLQVNVSFLWNSQNFKHSLLFWIFNTNFRVRVERKQKKRFLSDWEGSYMMILGSERSLQLAFVNFWLNNAIFIKTSPLKDLWKVTIFNWLLPTIRQNCGFFRGFVLKRNPRNLKNHSFLVFSEHITIRRPFSFLWDPITSRRILEVNIFSICTYMFWRSLLLGFVVTSLADA